MPPRPDDDDDDGLDRLRQVAAAVFIALSALLVLAVVSGRPIPDAFAGLVMGTMVALLGIETVVRAVRGDRDDP